MDTTGWTAHHTRPSDITAARLESVPAAASGGPGAGHGPGERDGGAQSAGGGRPAPQLQPRPLPHPRPPAVPAGRPRPGRRLAGQPGHAAVPHRGAGAGAGMADQNPRTPRTNSNTEG